MNTEGLLSYQIPAAEALLKALQTYGAAIDASDCGVGKTFTAGSVIRELDLPTLVVCPEVSIPSWQRMGRLLGVQFDCLNYEMIRTGSTPYGEWQFPRPARLERFLKCTRCTQVVNSTFPCRLHHLGIHCVEVKTKPHKYGRFNWYEGIKFLVFDEIHRCTALDSLQADMLLAAGRQRIKTLGLSASLADSPLHFSALGYVLKLHNYIDGKVAGSPPGFYGWAKGYGCQTLPFRGFHFAVGEQRKKEALFRLHNNLFPSRGARVRIKDLGASFPDSQITAELYNIEESGRVEEIYSRMDEALRTLNGIKDGDPAHPLTELLRARQELELLKVPIFEELTADATAQGMSVALFVNFRQTVEELCKRLKTNCRIDGSQIGSKGAAIRRANMEDFLYDRERIIVCTAAAGGIAIDLHDILGQFPRLGLISPGFSVREFKQILGRLRRHGAKSKSLYRALFIAGTREERNQKALAAKLNNLDILQDGDLMAANIPLVRFRESVMEGGEILCP